eukprot:scaffold25720_cov61-Attheya_sp.AAC.4
MAFAFRRKKKQRKTFSIHWTRPLRVLPRLLQQAQHVTMSSSHVPWHMWTPLDTHQPVPAGTHQAGRDPYDSSAPRPLTQS